MRRRGVGRGCRFRGGCGGGWGVGGWLGGRIRGGRRLGGGGGGGRWVGSPRRVVRGWGGGVVRGVADEPVRSVLFSAAGVELFGPDLVEAVRVADLVEYGQAPAVRVPDHAHGLAGQHEWLFGPE